MFLWFLGTAVAAVWYVFRDPRFDYRLLLVGAIAPDLIDLPGGNARWAHSLIVAVGTLAAVVLLTFGRRPIRKALLGFPIGVLLHLVFDAVWNWNEVFWWPFLGSWGDVEVPSLARGWWNVLLELAGAALLVWVARRADLADPDRRRMFVRHGLLRIADNTQL